MQKQSLEVKQVFSGLVEGFGINHAIVFHTLLTSNVKTASQIIGETGINQATTYSVLRDLLKWELIECSNTNPTNYFMQEPLKVFNRQAKKQEKEIECRRKALLKVIEKDTQELQNFTFQIGKGEQTKLVDVTTKKTLKYKEDLAEIKQQFDKMWKEAPEKEKNYVYSCYK